MKKLYCFLFGHDMIKETEIDNTHSVFGDFVCMRCGKRHGYQWDR